MKSEGRIVIDEAASSVSQDELCRELLHMSINELIKDISLNIGGEYDSLYKRVDE